MFALLTIVAALASMPCPQTGWTLHLDQADNAAARRELLRRGVESQDERDAQLEACRRSRAWWLTYFGWTFVVKAVMEDGREAPPAVPHVPFVPWPCQVEALATIGRCIEQGEDALLDKSRDMGASWLIVGAFVWEWQFQPDAHLLMVSRVEDLVDRMGDPDALFWKVDYLIQNQPPWLLPADKRDLARGGKHRAHMSLTNPRDGGTIMGQATTEHVGIAGRKRAVLCDEAARIPNFAQVWRGLGDTTSCRIANSTPFGGGTEFTRLRNLGLKEGSPRVIPLSYRDHPEKGAGGEWRIDEKGELVDIPGLRYWWSPWFARRAARGDKLDLAQNVLCIHEQSGRTIFHAPAIYRMRARARELTRCELIWERTGDGIRGSFTQTPKGRWWVDMAYQGERAAMGDFVLFADPSWGVGAANATIVVLDAENRIQVAEFADAATPPVQLGEQAAYAARTVFRGRLGQGAVGFEVNGPGGEFDGHLRRCGLSRIWRERIEGQISEETTKRFGWTSNAPKKRAAFLALNRGIVKGDVTLVSTRLLDEALEYVVCDDGSVDTPTNYDQETGAREGHGDLVVAAVGAYMMVCEPTEAQAEKPVYAPDTYGEWMGMNDAEEDA